MGDEQKGSSVKRKSFTLSLRNAPVVKFTMNLPDDDEQEIQTGGIGTTNKGESEHFDARTGVIEAENKISLCRQPTGTSFSSEEFYDTVKQGKLEEGNFFLFPEASCSKDMETGKEEEQKELSPTLQRQIGATLVQDQEKRTLSSENIIMKIGKLRRLKSLLNSEVCSELKDTRIAKEKGNSDKEDVVKGENVNITCDEAGISGHETDFVLNSSLDVSEGLPWDPFEMNDEKLIEFADVIKACHSNRDEEARAKAILWMLMSQTATPSLLLSSGMWDAVWSLLEHPNPRLVNRAVELLIHWNDLGYMKPSL